jgi:hypothetical protein
LPLDEFTAARNALAKQLGPAGAGMRALEKPNIASWAVNQLYWTRRPVHDRLIAAAAARRDAHARLLKGQGGDVASAEQAYSTALRAAATEIRAILKDTGHEPSPTTLNAVTDTLQALPAPGPAGRLIHPLRLVGFEALAGLVPKSALRGLSAPPAPAQTPERSRKAGSPEEAAAVARRDADVRKKADAARKREIEVTRAELAATRDEHREAKSALAAAERELARARALRDRLQDQLQFAVKTIDDRAAVVRSREEAAARTEREQARLEARLETLRGTSGPTTQS